MYSKWTFDKDMLQCEWKEPLYSNLSSFNIMGSFGMTP